MFYSDFAYKTEFTFGPDLGPEKIEADVLHDKVDMDAETYIIYGKSEKARGRIYKERPGNVIYGIDILIAETIAILNRKGYTTVTCCQGHLPVPNDGIHEIDGNNKDELRKLSELISLGYYEIVQIKGNTYYVAIGTTSCWIIFDEKTLPPFIPEGFSLVKIRRDNRNLFVIENTIPTYHIADGEPKKKSDEVVALELIQLHEDLKAWAYSLPSLVKENADSKHPAKV